MSKTVCLVGAALIFGMAARTWAQEEERRISVAAYRDKMAAGWVGQMAGVGWGAPTEFRYLGVIMPEDKMPEWKPEMINQYQQDDLYVEMTFLRSLEEHGFDLSMRQAGIDFANSGYPLWHANRYGRENLRNGIAPPDSGHPAFSKHTDDIDYQIEADYAGLIAPGMPNLGIALGEKFGRLMNYGDGLYGGQFVAGMYAEAFFETDPRALVEAGLACIPAGSQYAETVRDVLRWHYEAPEDWQAVWRRIDEKYHRNMDKRRYTCTTRNGFNIDAGINGAYIVLGLLYGAGDLDDTITIATRCGQDSDCNPSNAAGVLFTTLGLEKLPPRFTSALDRTTQFSHTAYDFDGLLSVCEKLARQAVARTGGRIEKDASGEEVFVIPVSAPKPSALERSWAAGPIANSRFTEAEMARIDPPEDEQTTVHQPADAAKVNAALAQFSPGWTISNCGADMDPGLHAALRGREKVFLSHPLNPQTPCVLSRMLELPEGNPRLRIVAGHHEDGDWVLGVKVNGTELLNTPISKTTAVEGWRTIELSLAAFAGATVDIALLNIPDGWQWEAAYWASIAVVTD